MTRSVAKNFAYNAGYQILKILTPLVTTPYIARVLGAELVGVFSYTQAVTNYFVMFAVLGMSTYGVRLIASAPDRGERSRRFCSAWLAQLGFGIIVIAAFAGMVVFDSNYRILWVCWSLWVISAAFDISWLFFGVEEFGLTTARSAAVTIAGLVAILALVNTRDDLALYVVIVSMQMLLSQLLLWPHLKKHVDWVRVGWVDVRVNIIPNLCLFIPVIATSLYNAMDTVIMGWLSTMTQTGFYQYSYKVALIPLAVITALGTVMLPRMSRTVAEGDDAGVADLLDTSLWIMLAMAFAFMWGIIGVSTEFVPVFLGEEFAPCVPVVALLATIIPLCSVTNVLGVQYLLPHTRDTQYTISVCIGAVANLAVSIALIPSMGAMGSAWGSVAAQAAVLVAQCIMVRQELPLLKYLLNSLPYLFIGASMAALLRLVAPLLTSALGIGALCLLAEVFVGVLLFTAFSIAWCLATKDRHLAILISTLKRMRRRQEITHG